MSDINCKRLEIALISIKNLVLLKNIHPFHDENQGTCNYYLLVILNKVMILTGQDYKNSHVRAIEIYRKNKRIKKENMQGINVKTCQMRKTRKKRILEKSL